MIECKLCKINKPKRMVIKRNSLEDVSDRLTSEQRQTLKMYLCKNKIKALQRNGKDGAGKVKYKWFETTCENHLIRDKRMPLK